jgi:hypothetical protein
MFAYHRNENPVGGKTRLVVLLNEITVMKKMGSANATTKPTPRMRTAKGITFTRVIAPPG